MLRNPKFPPQRFSSPINFASSKMIFLEMLLLKASLLRIISNRLARKREIGRRRLEKLPKLALKLRSFYRFSLVIRRLPSRTTKFPLKLPS